MSVKKACINSLVNNLIDFEFFNTYKSVISYFSNTTNVFPMEIAIAAKSAKDAINL